jgi:hypothetical protein
MGDVTITPSGPSFVAGPGVRIGLDESARPGRVRFSPTRQKLLEALVKAAAAIDDPVKDKDNPGFKGARYADLASVRDACRKPLADHGLVVTQHPSGDGNRATVTTIIGHISGEWMESELTLTAQDARPQSIGSAISYARRYALMAVLGIAADDDDGNEASGTKPRATPPKSAPDNHPTVQAAKEVFPEARQVSDEEAQAIRDRELDDSTRDEDEQALRLGLVAAFGPNKDDHKPWLFEVAKLPKREPINAFRAKTHAHRQALLDQLKLAELKKDDHVPF